MRALLNRASALAVLLSSISVANSTYAAAPVGPASTGATTTPPLVTAPPHSANAEADAKVADDRGLVAAKQGRAADALEQFRAAYQFSPTPPRLWRMAISELETSHPVEALLHLRAYVNEPNSDGKHMAEAPALIDEAYHLAGHVRLHAPDGALIYLDGSNNGVLADREIDIMPGQHVARIGDADPVPIVVAAGQLVDVDLAHPPSANPPREVGIASTNPATRPVAPAPDTTVPDAHEHESHAHRTAAIVVGAGAVVGLGLGITFAELSRTATSDGNKARSEYPAGFCTTISSAQCQYVSGKVNASRTDSTAAWISYGAAGVLALTAVGMLFWPESHGERPLNGWVAPMVGPSVAGASFGGSF